MPSSDGRFRVFGSGPFFGSGFIEEYAPDGIFGDPTGTSRELGEAIANGTADRIAADLRRFLELFPLEPRG